MRVVAGVDVGNASTEVVLADVTTDPPQPVAWDRAPTRGRKGSVEAALGAASLIERLARRTGIQPDAAATVPQRPADTTTRTLPRSLPDTGRIAVLAAGSRTPGRPGVASGRPVPLSAEPATGTTPVVLLVDAGLGYAEAAGRIDAWDGATIAGVLVEADEGVLIAGRIRLDVPVLDGVPVAAAVGAELVAMEVAEPGRPIGTLADPARLRALLGDVPAEDVQATARAVADAGSAAVALHPRDRARTASMQDQPAAGHDRHEDADDLWLVDLDAAAAEVEARRPYDRVFGAVASALLAHDRAADDEVRRALSAALDVPVLSVAGEAAAARAGALSTPGADPDATVLDLGGGTLDAIAASGKEAVVAGAGDAVTAAVAAVLGIPRGAADWVKRGPASRLEGPHLLLAEDGTRTFAEAGPTRGAEGCLVVPGPAGWLPFSRELAPAEWRTLRLHLKRVVLGDNVARCLQLLGDDPAEILLVGGVAGDEEVLRVLDRVAPGALIGRADVAGGVRPGTLGHRWAVAYGAVLLAR